MSLPKDNDSGSQKDSTLVMLPRAMSASWKVITTFSVAALLSVSGVVAYASFTSAWWQQMSSFHSTFGDAKAAVAPRARDFSYLNETLEKRYKNKTILFVFAGRRSRLAPQVLYLEKLVNDGEVDYVHYYHCGPSMEDSAWLKNLTTHLPAWFELRMEPECGPNLFNSVYNVYDSPEYNSSTLVKIDDDIVFLSTGGGLSRMVEYANAHPEALWTSALVLNNPLVDYYLQQEGVTQKTTSLDFSAIPQEGDVIGIPATAEYAKNKHSLSALHDLFLSNSSLFLNLDGVYRVPSHYRMCLNFMVFTPAQQKRWQLPPKHGFDEMAVRQAGIRTNSSVHIFKGHVAVHLNYGRQRQAGLVDERHEELYREFACEFLNLPKHRCALPDMSKLIAHQA